MINNCFSDVHPEAVSPQTPDPARDSDEIPEFEPNDKKEYFELWSSDATSPDEESGQVSKLN